MTRARIRFLWPLLLALLPIAQAQPWDTLSQLLDLASERPAVQQAQLTLEEAQRAAERTSIDPLALRLERLQATQRLELAAAELLQAQLNARLEIARSWTRVREANAQLALTEAAAALAERALDIAKLRAERGSATNLDVDQAAVALADAARNRDSARDGLALASDELRTLTGVDANLDPLLELTIPTLSMPSPTHMRASMDRLPQALQVAHAVALAGVAVELLDPSFASRAQIEQAQTQLENVRTNVRELNRGLDLQLQSLINQVIASESLVQIALEELTQAQTRESFETRRLEAGLIAAINLEQVQLQTKQAALRAMLATHQQWLAHLELQARTLVALEARHAQ